MAKKSQGGLATDHPLAFFDNCWLAVKAGEPKTIIEKLDLSQPTNAIWREGLEAVCGDWWDFDESLQCSDSRVFITPLVAGWRLVIGGWFGAGDTERWMRLVHHCRDLSAEFGEAHAFTSQGRMDWYSWMLAEGGNVFRQFLWGEKVLIDKGAPTASELRLRQQKAGAWQAREVDVMTLAGEYSVNPVELGPTTPSTGSGILAVTPWGRANGVPRRPLSPH